MQGNKLAHDEPLVHESKVLINTCYVLTSHVIFWLDRVQSFSTKGWVNHLATFKVMQCLKLIQLFGFKNNIDNKNIAR